MNNLKAKVLSGWLGMMILGLGGCAAPQTRITLDPVGPPRVSGSIIRGKGQLQVYSECDRVVSGGISSLLHSPYWVYNQEGKKVRSVQNHAGSTDQHATVITLPSGQYRVLARAEGYGLVTVPVTITSENVTEVYLERGGMPHASEIPATNLVRLPDGAAVGWRFKPAPSKP